MGIQALNDTDLRRLGRLHSVTEALGHAGPAPALPGWVTAWTEADADRPWPPMRDDGASP